jgi:hypothetical protein
VTDLLTVVHKEATRGADCKEIMCRYRNSKSAIQGDSKHSGRESLHPHMRVDNRSSGIFPREELCQFARCLPIPNALNECTKAVGIIGDFVLIRANDV